MTRIKLNPKKVKPILLIATPAIILFLVVLLMFFLFTKKPVPNQEVSILIAWTKDVFQVIFFIVAGVITILTYVQAKKTLFTPIKTETFKMQVKAFEDILAFFQNKTESDFIEQFDYDFMFRANAKTMIDDYIETFFKDKIETNATHPLNKSSKIVGAVMSHQFAEKYLLHPEYYKRKEFPEKEVITNPAMQLESWTRYEYGQILFSKSYQEETNKLTQLIASPLIPQLLKDKLETFENKVRKNFYQIGHSLNSISKELPEKLPTVHSIVNVEISGMWNKYNRDREELESTARHILDYIRSYLKIDSLIE